MFKLLQVLSKSVKALEHVPQAQRLVSTECALIRQLMGIPQPGVVTVRLPRVPRPVMKQIVKPEKAPVALNRWLDEYAIDKKIWDGRAARALLMAIIRRAAFDWVLYKKVTTLPEKHYADDAKMWLFDEREGHPYQKIRKETGTEITSFLSICELLDLDPNRVRNEIQQLTPKQIMSIGRPPDSLKDRGLEESSLPSGIDVEVLAADGGASDYPYLRRPIRERISMEVKKPRRPRKSVAAKPKTPVRFRFEGVGFYAGDSRRPFAEVAAELQDKYNELAQTGNITVSFLNEGILLGQKVEATQPQPGQSTGGTPPATPPQGMTDESKQLVNRFIERLPANPLDKKEAVRSTLKSWFDREGLTSFMQLKEAVKMAQAEHAAAGDAVGATFFEELLMASEEIRLILN